MKGFKIKKYFGSPVNEPQAIALPFLKKMEKDLEYKEDDPVFISKFKTELWSDLEKRCLET